MKFIPFGITPAGLGLKGKDRERAEAYYTLKDEALHRRLCEIDFEKDSIEYKKQMKELNVEYDTFDSEEEREYAKHEVAFLEDEHSDEALLAKAELDKKYNKLTDVEYDKEISTIKNEAWVGYKEYALEETEEGGVGFWFDFDWNIQFIEKLKEAGYEGQTEEEIVRLWYAELCRTIALEDGLAMDLFDGEQEVEPVHVAKAAIKKKNLDDGHTEYS